MRILTLTKPTAEPVTLTEAKLHCKIEQSDEDALIESLISAAREWCEAYCNRAIGLQTIELALPAFADPIEVPRPPLRTVDSIRYLDTDGALQTLATDVYRVIDGSDSRPALLEIAPNKSVPSTDTSAAAVRVRYQAGWDIAGSPADEVPEGIKAAIKLIVGDLYEHREARLDMQTYDNPTARMLLAPFWVPSL